MHLRNLVGALALRAVLAPGPALAVEAGGEPEPAVPAEVAAWFVAAADEHVREGAEVLDVPEDQRDDIAVGAPRVVRTWADSFIDGSALEPVSVPLEEWIAPLVLQSAEQPAPVGTVRAWRDPEQGGAVSLATMDGDTELAGTLLSLAPGVAFILDAPLDAWFSAADGEIWPLTSRAEEVLVGSVPVEAFQPLLAERYEAAERGGGGDSAGGAGEPSEEDDGPRPVLVAVLAVLLLGAAAGTVVVRQHRRTDSRLDADVRGDHPDDGAPVGPGVPVDADRP
ncbi:hypothetical protein V2J56_13700 [Georgenia sp. MJ206]|uniref:hypothetical protein n=1 Tax=Georgenia wangjunii TaxID=3117730 RepID=UPI002F263291